MAKFMTTKEAAEKWNITERRINVLCKEGRIPGAYKENKRWVISADAVKPADKRLKEDGSVLPSKKKLRLRAIRSFRYQSESLITVRLPVNITMWIRLC